MMPSRGMGAIKQSKVPKKGTRKDGASFDMYKEGGAVWDKPNPKKKPKPLTSSQKTSAKAAATRAGRPYPNLVDNMRASMKAKK